MIKRTIDIAHQSYVHLEKQQLLIEQQGETVGSIPVEDLGILILEHPAITISQSVLLACQKNNVAVVFCDERHCPYSTLLPISEGNKLHNKALRHQVSVSVPTQKRLWKEIIQEKIKQQVRTLEETGKNPVPLERMVAQVKSGDKENHEAQAAQKYWKLLMGPVFRRNPDESGINALLNYGYSIVRAMVARALVGTGLHPALGLFHHNQYNGLALADDLMEPFRPWVDSLTLDIVNSTNCIEINSDNKRKLLGLLDQPVVLHDGKMPLMVASHHLAANLKQAYMDQNVHLTWPTRLH